MFFNIIFECEENLTELDYLIFVQENSLVYKKKRIVNCILPV